MDSKAERYFGFAKKSGNLVTGMGTCRVMAKKGRLKLLVMTENIAEDGLSKAQRLAEAGNIPYRIFGTSERLSHAVGTTDRKVFGITDEHFATIICEQIDREQQSEKEVFA